MVEIPRTFPAHTGFNFTKTLHTHPTPAIDPSKQNLPHPYVVCVTGSGRGIGAATAKAFALAGASGVILTARTTSALEKTKKEIEDLAADKNIKVSIVTCDAGKEESAHRIAEVVKTEHGRLDVLVNNAGMLVIDEKGFAPYMEVPSIEISSAIEVNYLGKIWTTRALFPLLMESPNGAKILINITSLGSQLVGGAAISFRIAEWALNRLTEYFDETYRDQGLLSFALHPGAVISTPPPGVSERLLKMSKDDIGLSGAFSVWLAQTRPEWLSGRYLSATWDVDELVEKKEEIVAGDKLKARMVV